MKKIILKNIIRNDIIYLMEYNMEKYLKKGTQLYGFSGWFITKYFKTEDELIDFCKINGTDYGSICIIVYLDSFMNRESVIMKKFLNREDIIVSPIDYDYVEIYNFQTKEWQKVAADFKSEYEAFRKIGKLKKDVYLELDSKLEDFNKCSEEKIRK